MKKTMLDFLNEVSKEKGFDSWYKVYLIGNDEMHNSIPQEAGVRFAAQKISQFNNNDGWESVTPSDFDWINGTQ